MVGSFEVLELGEFEHFAIYQGKVLVVIQYFKVVNKVFQFSVIFVIVKGENGDAVVDLND